MLTFIKNIFYCRFSRFRSCRVRIRGLKNKTTLEAFFSLGIFFFCHIYTYIYIHHMCIHIYLQSICTFSHTYVQSKWHKPYCMEITCTGAHASASRAVCRQLLQSRCHSKCDVMLMWLCGLKLMCLCETMQCMIGSWDTCLGYHWVLRTSHAILCVYNIHDRWVRMP